MVSLGSREKDNARPLLVDLPPIVGAVTQSARLVRETKSQEMADSGSEDISFVLIKTSEVLGPSRFSRCRLPCIVLSCTKMIQALQELRQSLGKENDVAMDRSKLGWSSSSREDVAVSIRDIPR